MAAGRPGARLGLWGRTTAHSHEGPAAGSERPRPLAPLLTPSAPLPRLPTPPLRGAPQGASRADGGAGRMDLGWVWWALLLPCPFISLTTAGPQPRERRGVGGHRAPQCPHGWLVRHKVSKPRWTGGHWGFTRPL